MKGRGRGSGWHGDSRRHGMARKGIKTAKSRTNLTSKGIVDFSTSLHHLRSIFDREIPKVKMIDNPLKSRDELFGEILDKAEKNMGGITDGELVRLEEYADQLYAEYLKEDSKYYASGVNEQKRYKVIYDIGKPHEDDSDTIHGLEGILRRLHRDYADDDETPMLDITIIDQETGRDITEDQFVQEIFADIIEDAEKEREESKYPRGKWMEEEHISFFLPDYFGDRDIVYDHWAWDRELLKVYNKGKLIKTFTREELRDHDVPEMESSGVIIPYKTYERYKTLKKHKRKGWLNPQTESELESLDEIMKLRRR